jgi:hypothetical protein
MASKTKPMGNWISFPPLADLVSPPPREPRGPPAPETLETNHRACSDLVIDLSELPLELFGSITMASPDPVTFHRLRATCWAFRNLSEQQINRWHAKRTWTRTDLQISMVIRDPRVIERVVDTDDLNLTFQGAIELCDRYCSHLNPDLDASCRFSFVGRITTCTYLSDRVPHKHGPELVYESTGLVSSYVPSSRFQLSSTAEYRLGQKHGQHKQYARGAVCCDNMTTYRYGKKEGLSYVLFYDRIVTTEYRSDRPGPTEMWIPLVGREMTESVVDSIDMACKTENSLDNVESIEKFRLPNGSLPVWTTVWTTDTVEKTSPT